jgi:hypothetical protein
MIIDSSTLISNFHEMFKEQYSHISPSEMKMICTSEFDMLKEIMDSGSLEEVRLQYLFSAQVSASKVIKSLESLYKNRKASKISLPIFVKYQTMFLKFVNDNPKKFEKYKERLNKLTL